MSKNKDSLNDKIIALRTDHSITLHDIDEVSDITKDKGIEYLLVSVGTYSPEYLVIERDKFIRKFHKAYMKLLLSIEIYCDGMCINTDLKNIDMECNNVIEFYRMVHSLYKLRACDVVDSNMFNYEGCTTEYKLKNVELFVDIKKNSKLIDIDRESEGTKKHDVAYVIETLNFMAMGSCDKDIIPAVRSNEFFFICPEAGTWTFEYNYDDKFKPKDREFEYLRSVSLCTFNCIVFIPARDYEMLKTIDTFKMYTNIYIPIEQNPLPIGTDINGYNIIDLDGYYIELLSVLECCAYSVDEIIEFIVNFKYLYSHYLVRDDAIYGYMETYVVLEFMYILKGKAANRECREEFHFSKNADSIKDKNDFYDEFMHDLAKSIKKHTGGKRNGK